MRQRSSQPLATVVTVAVAYLFVAWLSRSLADIGTQTVPVWLSAGVVFGALICAGPGHRFAVVVAAAVASLVWGLVGHKLSVAAALPFAAIEVASVAVGAWVALRGRHGADLGVGAVGALIAGTLITATLGATLAGEFWRWQRPGAAYGTEWRAWAFSTAGGILLVAPLIEAFRGFRIKRSGGMPMTQFGAGAAAFSAFLVTAWVVFGTGGEQRFGTVAATLGYLPMPFLLLSAMVWGARGGSLAMLTGALLVIGLTTAGGGPFVVADSFAGEAVIEVQAYVAVWAMMVLLVRGLSESRRQALQQARDWQLRYERTLQATGVANVEFDAVTGAAVWAEHAPAVLGTATSAFENVDDWLACTDEADRPLAEAAWRAVSEGRKPAASETYSVRLGGRTRAVQVRWAGICGPDGAVERVAGLLRPIDDQQVQDGGAGGSRHG